MWRRAKHTMTKHKVPLRLSRVEIVTRSFNESNQCVREEWEYYYPEESDTQVPGFKKTKK